MDLRGRTETEFLIDIQGLEDMKKEFILDPGAEKYLPVSYKSYRHADGFFIFNVYSSDFQKTRDDLKKWGKYELVITETNWRFSDGELKPSDGKKMFVKCQIIDIRKDFFQIKIIS